MSQSQVSKAEAAQERSGDDQVIRPQGEGGNAAVLADFYTGMFDWQIHYHEEANYRIIQQESGGIGGGIFQHRESGRKQRDFAQSATYRHRFRARGGDLEGWLPCNVCRRPFHASCSNAQVCPFIPNVIERWYSPE